LAETRDSADRSLLSKLRRGDGRPTERGKWFRANLPSVAMLLSIFILALFVRSYFAYQTSVDNDYIVSGGSDSYYWYRIIDYNAETGKQLFFDPLINFPDGIRNPRPPLYSMSVAVPAVVLQDAFASLSDSTGFMFIWSTAFWGALTVFPVYTLGKEVFGRRAGLAAAFLLAVMPSHVQRSVLSNADHDAIIQFFMVLAFFFLLKAVKTQQHKVWVENWLSPASIRSGLKDYLANSRTPILYSLMAGVAFGCIIMAWIGFAYVAVLILAYYVIQVVLNRFKNVDSLGVTVVIFMSMGLGYLLAFPVYYEQDLMFRLDVTFYLFLAAVAFGMMFVATRKYPWTLVIPAVAILLIIAVLAISVVYPPLAEAIMSGQGYFGASKLYSTIAEVRAPRFSELAMSFGMVTFYLSLVGLVWAIVKIPKRTTAEYIFMVVWLAAAIMMAITAARFMFNAAPAFALAAGWIVVMIVDALDFSSVRKSLAGASGSFLQVFRRSVKVRHVVGVLFLGFLIVLPNVWYSVDAGIPSETKRSYDKEIYTSIPSFMQPGDYDRINGSNWYLGAFGYSLPLPSYYFPASWEWFSEQDSDVYPETARPAYVAWWDYGFEAVQEGKHPTVADNFQNGYQMTGNVIMAQTEEDTIALFAYRLIQAGMGRDASVQAAIADLYDEYGVDADRMDEVLSGPGQELIDEVLSDSMVYGPMASDLSDVNARLVLARVELQKMGSEALVSFYGDMCDITGWQIRYFSVDSRMFPISGTETGIYYAPAKLSDRRLNEYGMPYDFYVIKAVDSSGREYDIESVTSNMNIVDYSIAYQDMFYDSMFYRAMAGYSGSDIGLSNDGVPGISGSVQSYNAMPGWNLTHFKMVYRTAYYNPWPSAEVALHGGDWAAISYDEAVALKKQISAGEIEGVVDDNPISLYRSGCVFLKYYAGAIVSGTLTTEQGAPAANVRVTVQDEYGIPHQMVFTDADGQYSALAPFGNVTLVFSTGDVTTPSLAGSNVITRLKFNVTDDQAMRVEQDLNGDGISDYYVTKDYVMRGSAITGDIFWDVDSDGNYTANTDELIPDAVVYATDVKTGRSYRMDAHEGSIDTYLPPGQYNVTADILGTNLTMAELSNVTAGDKATFNLPIVPAELSGYLKLASGEPAAGVDLVLRDLTTGYEYSAMTNTNGSYLFDRAQAGKYQMVAPGEEGRTMFREFFVLGSVVPTERNVTLFDSQSVRFRVTNDGLAVPYAVYLIADVFAPSSSVSGFADEFGWVECEIPVGAWTLYATHSTGVADYSNALSFEVSDSDVVGTLALEPAMRVVGAMKTPKGAVLKEEFVCFQSEGGARVYVKTNRLGTFDVMLPVGTYDITSYSISSKGVYSGSVILTDNITGLSLRMTDAVSVSGTMFLDMDSNGEIGEEELGRYVGYMYTDPNGRLFMRKSADSGDFAMVFPKGSDITLMIAVDGYRAWSQELLFAADITSTAVIVDPDDLAVSGRVSWDGQYLSGIKISFIPEGSIFDIIEVTSGTGGYYSVSLLPSTYTVSIGQEVSTSLPGVRYEFEDEAALLPSAEPVTFDITPVKKAELYGTVLGAGSDISLRLVGPEELSVDLDLYSYSAYVLPGTYQVYASGTLAGYTYASMTTVEVPVESTQYDIQLTRAYSVSGVISVESAPTSKSVTVSVSTLTGETTSVQSIGTGWYSVDLPEGTYIFTYLLEGLASEADRTLYVEYAAEKVVTVGSGELIVNANLLMRMDNTTFSGTVLDADGDPIQAFVELKATSIYGMDASFYTSSSGSFSASVQPGDYTLYITRSVDRFVSLSYLRLTRNLPYALDSQLSEGRYLSGTVTVAGAPASETVSASSGSAQLSEVSDASGRFSFLVPEGNYSLSSSTTRVEGGITITYSKSYTASVGADDVYADYTLNRGTKRSVEASWNISLTATATPGETVLYVFIVENTGNIADTYTCTYSGSGFEVSFLPSELAVDFGTNGKVGTMVAEITVGDAVKSGSSELKVTVKSKSQSSTRSDLKLYVDVAPMYSVKVISLNESASVSSTSTITKFKVNNTGNIEGEFTVQIANLPSLAELGWTAKVTDPSTGETLSTVSLGAFEETELEVEFTATRTDANPEAEAYVLAQLVNETSVSAYGAVPVMLPDLVLGPGDVEVVRDDISYSYDAERLYMDIGLVATLGALLALFFIMRRRKGIGGGAKK